MCIASQIIKIGSGVIKAATTLFPIVSQKLNERAALRQNKFESIDKCLASALDALITDKDSLLKTIIGYVPRKLVEHEPVQQPYVQEWLIKPDVQGSLKEIAINAKLGFVDQSDYIEFTISSFSALTAADKRAAPHIVEGVVNYLVTTLKKEEVAVALDGLKKLYKKIDENHQAILQDNQRQFEKLETIEGKLDQLPSLIHEQAIFITDKILESNSEPSNSLIEELTKYNKQIPTDPKGALDSLLGFKKKYEKQADKTIKFKLFVYIGNCHREMHDLTRASRWYAKATTYAPSEWKKLQIESLSQLLLGDMDKAKKLAQESCKLNPSEASSFALLLEASKSSQNDNFEKLIPVEHQDALDCCYTISQAYLQAKKYKKAIYWIKKAVDAEPEDIMICTLYGTILLEEHASSPAIYADEQISQEIIENIILAKNMLQKVWQQYDSLNPDAYITAGCNLIAAYRMLGNNQETLPILKKLEPHSDKNQAIVVSWVYHETTTGELTSALERIENTKNPSLELELIRLEILLHKEDFLTADELASFILKKKIPDHLRKIVIYHKALCQFFLFGFTEMDQYLKPFLSEYESDTQFITFAAKAYFTAQQKDIALNLLDNSFKILTKDQSLGVFETASLLVQNQQYEKALALIDTSLVNFNDNSLLQLKIQCLLALDSRKELSNLFSLLSDNTLNQKFYLRYQAFLYLRSGKLNELITCAENYFKKHGEDLELRLLWIEAKTKLGLISDIRKRLRILPSYEDENPLLRINLAYALVHYGHAKEALKQTLAGYQINPHSQEIKEAFLHFIVHGHGLEEQKETNKVAVNTVVTYKDELDKKYTSAIVKKHFNLSIQEITDDKPFAQKLLGKTVGSTVSLNTHHFEITEISPIHLHIFNQCVKDLTSPGVDSKYVQSIQLPKKDGELDFSYFFELLDNTQDSIDRAIETYKTTPLPIGSIAVMLKKNLFETWRLLLEDSETPIRCITGEGDLLQQGVDLLNKNNEALIIDPLTVDLLFKIDVTDELIKYNRRLLVTQSTIDFFIKASTNLKKTHDADGTMIPTGDGRYQYIKYTPEMFEEEEKKLRTISDWLRYNCELVDATPVHDLKFNGSRPVTEILDYTLWDTMYAASSEECVLISDDSAYRSLSYELYSIIGCNTQQLLLSMFTEGFLSFEKYIESVVILYSFNFDWTTFNDQVLVHLAEANTLSDLNKFTKLATVFARQDVHYNSIFPVISVVLRSLFEINDFNRIPQLTKRTFLHTLLDQLAKNPQRNTYEILSDFVRLVNLLPSRYHKEFLTCVNSWCKMRFLSIERVHEYLQHAN